ncbi:SWIB/MDM2 domain-containing protein [Pontixanthobacter sp.]|uniref:SWIB/MDM2 domain-containing protein n=1 Tax=Pontixanthobacter sp. TaxID=2792078 RepID=UPI003C7E6BC6
MAGKNNALQKPVTLSGELENVIGKGPMTRAQVTSKIWEYIKGNDLQDSKDKRQINPDAKLSAVIGKDQISMFKMTAAVSKHLT